MVRVVTMYEINSGRWTWKAWVFLQREYITNPQLHFGVEYCIQTPVVRLVGRMLHLTSITYQCASAMRHAH